MNRFLSRVALGLALPLSLSALSGLPAFAHSFTLGALEIGHPYSLVTSKGVRTGVGYLSVTNTGTEPDRLIAVKADFPKVEIHTTVTDAAGVARMTEVEGVEIAPGATVALAPRGEHVMFMGLTEPLAEGAKIPATLVFEKAGEVAVEFNVEARKPGEAAEDHEGH